MGRQGRFWGVAGLVVAGTGVPLFFNSTFRLNLLGLGLITFGLGIALIVLIGRTTRAELAAARTSAGRAAVSGVWFAIHGWVAWLAGVSLVAFGALCLLVALASG